MGSSDDECSEEDVDEGGLEEDDPAEFHELIVAEARDCPADEDEEVDEYEEFGEEDAEVEESAEMEIADGEVVDVVIQGEACGPTAEEEGDDEGGADDHGGVFSHEEHGKFHGGVFGMIATDEFGFAFGEIKGHAVCFCEDGYGEDEEGDECGDQEEGGLEAGEGKFVIGPEGEEQPAMGSLGLDDVVKV